MKKIMTAVAAFSMLTASVTVASAMDSIDMMGKAPVTISVAATQLQKANSPKVAFDSNAVSTAMVPAGTATSALKAASVHDAAYCLDSNCVSNIKL